MSENIPICSFQMGKAMVYLMDISSVDDTMFSESLPTEMLTHAYTAFKSHKRQKEWLGTRLLLQRIAGKEAQIAYEVTGAPILKNSSQHISISHSGTIVAIALSDHRIGLDIQEITDKALRLKSRFLSNEEMMMWSPNLDVEGAVQLWCAKEAVYKYLSIPGTELIGGIVLNKEKGELVETLHDLHLHLNKYDNVVMAIAEK